MSKNILFILNTYPGCGGLESVTDNVIEYLWRKYSIYTVSCKMQDGVSAPKVIKKMYKFDKKKDKKKSVELLNQIIETHHIDCIVNQGIYPHISDILFHPLTKRVAKVFSFLHGMPLYELAQCRQEMSRASAMKRFKHKFLTWSGIYCKYDRYVKHFADSYKTAFVYGDKIVLLCGEYIEDFRNAYQLDGADDKIIAIENPLSLSFSLQEAPWWEDKKNKIIFVGRLTPEKRVDIVIEVWSRLQNISQWELVIVGDCRGQLEDMVDSRHIERVSFTGQLSSVEDQYKDAKIILLTSLYEGFPMCLIEAQRFGVVPVAFQASAGVKSVVADAGVLVPQDDIEIMTEKLNELINNDNELHRLSDKARSNSQRYTIEAIGGQWDKLIES